MKRIKSVVAANALGAFAQNKGTVGLSKPTKSSARDGANDVQSPSGPTSGAWRA